MRLYCSHEIPRSAETFWAMLEHPAYEAAVAEAVGLAVYREIERREEEGALYRRIHAEPRGLPSYMKTLLRRAAGVEGGSFEEEQWRRSDAMELEWRMTPSVLAERVRAEGVLRVESVDAGRCRRVLDGEVGIRVLGLGGVLERTVVRAAEDAYATAAEVAARDELVPG